MIVLFEYINPLKFHNLSKANILDLSDLYQSHLLAMQVLINIDIIKQSSAMHVYIIVELLGSEISLP